MNYWKKRALENRELTDAIEASSFVRLNKLLKNTFDKVNNELEEFDLENINDYLTAKEVKELKAIIKKAASYNERDAIMRKLFRDSAKLYKYNRLEGLKISLQALLSEMTAGQQKNINSTLIKAGTSSYKFAAETFSKKYAVDLSGISRATVQTLADQTWVGTKNWSQRIWKDRQLLGESLDTTLKEGIARGYPLEKIARDIKLKFQTSTYEAMRLVRTETTHVHEQAILKLYEDTNTEKYVYMATIDDRTSEICRELNGKKFFVSEAEPGVNLPPMHPNCRSTTAPVPNIKRLYEKYGINEKEPEEEKTNNDEILFKKNDTVSHLTFGQGKIISKEKDVVTVDFGEKGVKKIKEQFLTKSNEIKEIDKNTILKTEKTLKPEKNKKFSEFTDKDVEENRKFLYKTLSREERDSLRSYSGSGIAEKINRKLRRNNADILNNKDVQILTSILDKSKLDKDYMLYRSVRGIPDGIIDKSVKKDLKHIIEVVSYNDRGLFEKGTMPDNEMIEKANEYFKLLKGKTLTDKGFMSTTRDPDLRGSHGQELFGSIKMTLFAPKGTHGLSIEDISKWEDEHEVLIQRGTSIRIQDIKIHKKEVKNGKFETRIEIIGELEQ